MADNNSSNPLKSQIQIDTTSQYPSFMDWTNRRAEAMWYLRNKKKMTIQEIADIYKIAKQRVSQIITTNKRLKELRKAGDTK